MLRDWEGTVTLRARDNSRWGAEGGDEVIVRLSVQRGLSGQCSDKASVLAHSGNKGLISMHHARLLRLIKGCSCRRLCPLLVLLPRIPPLQATLPSLKMRKLQSRIKRKVLITKIYPLPSLLWGFTASSLGWRFMNNLSFLWIDSQITGCLC